MSGSLKLTSNVKVTVLDQSGRVKRVANIHNKATESMLEGILRFLSGDFNTTEFSPNYSSINFEDAKDYVPVELRVGRVGVDFYNPDSSSYLTGPFLLEVDNSKMKIPTIDDYQLQDEIHYTEVVLSLRSGQESSVDYARQSKSVKLGFETSYIEPYNSSNSSMSLILRTFIPSGKLVLYSSDELDQPIPFTNYNITSQTSYLGWVYYNGEEYETMITELGLYSTSGRLLARVLFDGKVNTWEVKDPNTGALIYYDYEFEDPLYDKNPIIQTETTSLVVEWKISVISVGDNDSIISYVNIDEMNQDPRHDSN